MWRFLLPLLLMLVFALTRWPGLMPPNFSAAYALAFCAAVYFPPLLAWTLPLGTLLLTDLLLNAFYYQVAPFSAHMLPNYFGFAAIIFLGRQFSSRSSWPKLVVGGLAGAILFYLVSNTASWAQNPEYAKSLWGWIQALTTGTAGPPPTWQFFRNTLLSSGLFAGLFAGAMKLCEKEENEETEEPCEEPQTEETETVT
jgi:hypothetical protein